MLDTQQTRQGYSLYGRLMRKSELTAQQEFVTSQRERTESGDRIPDIVHSRDGDDGFRLRKILDRPRPTTSLRWARGGRAVGLK
jgi:hypothetical protein